MSGIVGMLRLDGGRIDAPLLQHMTDALAFRGPDAQQIWTNGSVGFGHTMLRTTTESATERQPSGLNDETWIVADARIDARADLIAKLQDAGRTSCSSQTPDAELILHAYKIWGESCVEHFIGDFAFAIWDAGQKRLFCARDQFGVKPFFYVRTPTCFLFSNTLDCLLLHPEISGKLNDAAIADFLLFDFNQDPGTTVFADISRLPPAHALRCEQADVAVRCYWKLPVATEIRYRDPAEYLEHFDQLMSVAVEDRLRSDAAGVLMSGGLDSPVVAAQAQRIYQRKKQPDRLHAYTEVYDRLFPHEERYYASLVAEALAIQIHYEIGDERKLYTVFEEPEFMWPEPVHCPWGSASRFQLREVALRSRVALTGFGADPALSSSLSSHFRNLLHRKQFGKAIGDMFSFLSADGRLSRLYFRTRWAILFRSEKDRPWFPPWIDAELEKRLDLRNRWAAFGDASQSSSQAIRPTSHAALIAPLWANLFEAYDPGVSRVAVEARHPFFDLRLLNFLLALPAIPWCSDKELLRRSTRGVLPEKVRLRRKSPLSADPLILLLQRPESAWADTFQAAPELERYVVRSKIPSVSGETDTWKAWVHLRPLSLNFWLRRSAALRYK